MRRTEIGRAALLQSIVEARDQLLDGCLALASSEARANPLVGSVIHSLKRYVSASDWNLVDVVILALCLDETKEDLVRRLAATVLAFHALRMVDDVIDGHSSYKGDYPTMYGELASKSDLKPVAGDVTLVSALLLLSEGIAGYPAILADLQRTILGALHERVATDPASEYDSIVLGKMVSYGMVLYSPVMAAADEESRPIVSSFLRASFRIGQLMNDLLDFEADRGAKQPNFWHIHPEDGPELMVRELGDLAARVESLPKQYRPYGETRLVDLAGYGIQIADRVALSEGG